MLGAIGVLIPMVCAGCSTDSQATKATPSTKVTLPTPSLSPTSADAITAADDAKSATSKSLAAYRSMWAAFEKAISIPDPQYPQLRQTSTGDALAILVKSVEDAKAKGLKGTGKAVFDPEVVQIVPASKPLKTTIRDCLDTSGSHLVKATPGGTPYKDEPGGRQLTIAIVQRQDDGSWKVTSVGTRDVGSC